MESIESKFKRVEKDDPNRCQATHRDYQCPFRAVGSFVNGQWEGPKYCPRHGGTTQATQAAEIESKKMYLSAKWKDRISKMSDHPELKSLREEIGILRMLLETKLDHCKDDVELMLHASGITELVNKINDIVRAWHKIEKDSGQLLDRAQAIVFVQSLIGIINMYVSDPDILKAMSEDMVAEFDKLVAGNR